MTSSDPNAADRALVTRMAAGDEAALARLYDRFGTLAYSLALRVLGEAADAEEAVSDAFVQAWNSASSFDAARGSVSAWIAMIARTRALDRLRARSRRGAATEKAATLDEAGLAAAVSEPGPAPDAAAETADTRARINAALAELPEPQRRALMLAYFDGLSHSEIAQALDQPLGTVKTRIRAGLDKLRTALPAYVWVE
jgi:RNA polymerase sigma-70 factor (ECF subfamily)